MTLNWRSASSWVVATVPPKRGLDHAVDVAGIEAVARRLFAVDLDVQVGLAEHAEDAEIGDAFDLIHLGQDLVGDLLELGEVGADDLDGVRAFDARQAFFDVVLDVLGEIEGDAGEFPGEFGLQILDQLLLGHAGRAIRRTA